MSHWSAEFDSRLRKLVDELGRKQALDGGLWDAAATELSKGSGKFVSAVFVRHRYQTLVGISISDKGKRLPNQQYGSRNGSGIPVPVARKAADLTKIKEFQPHLPSRRGMPLASNNNLVDLVNSSAFQAPFLPNDVVPLTSKGTKRKVENHLAADEPVKRRKPAAATSLQGSGPSKVATAPPSRPLYDASDDDTAAMATTAIMHDDDDTTEPRKQLRSRLTIDEAHRQPPILPRHPCALTGIVDRQQNDRAFRLRMRVRIGKASYNGVCLIHAANFKPTSLQLLQQGDLLEEDLRRCEARFLSIEGEDEEDFAVDTKVYWRDIAVIGKTWIPKTEINIELLNHYDVIVGGRLPVQDTVEWFDDHEMRVEEANKRNRTVAILGQMLVGERKRLDVTVEVWSWDGRTSMQCRARIMERKASADGFHVALRVKLAEQVYVYLRGWMHADMLSGRFAEEFPGEVFVD